MGRQPQPHSRNTIRLLARAERLLFRAQAHDDQPLPIGLRLDCLRCAEAIRALLVRLVPPSNLPPPI